MDNRKTETRTETVEEALYIDEFTTRDGKTIPEYDVTTEKEIYKCYSHRVKSLLGQKITFTAEPKEKQGQPYYAMRLPKEDKQSGGGYSGKSFETVNAEVEGRRVNQMAQIAAELLKIAYDYKLEPDVVADAYLKIQNTIGG